MSTVSATYSNLRVHPYDLVSLEELTITKEMNNHARLRFTGIIPEEKQESYVEMTEADTAVEIRQLDNQGNTDTLFHGIVLHVGIKTVRSVYYLEVEAISHTYLLDVKKKKRSFQNHAMTYGELLNQVASDYDKFDVMDAATDGAAIGNFTLQYLETDWEFLKRMASRFHTSLMPVATATHPKFYLGVFESSSKGKLDNYHYQLEKRMDDYHYYSANDEGAFDENDFIDYEVETETVLDLGSMIEFKGRQMYVRAVHTQMKQGVALHRYWLCSRKGLRQRQLYNEKIIGASIQGKVIGIVKDTVKIHLYIDKAQDVGTAHCFPYSSMYTAEGSSGWYCMPETGDHVRIYFPGSREEEAVASSSVRQDKSEGTSNKVSDPDKKILRTAAGKEIMLAPDEIVITGKDGAVFIRLNEGGGIEIISNQQITLKAAQDIMINSDKNVTISAKDEISLSCKESSILMDGSTRIIGKNLNTN
ncbi:contractile injection system protein, VgrG/Pvc8 family [Paenibacillus wulumuqiensis]|uniref:contractile injection system protein, VgrG/Pvc8 family n=1 Tax=Paenibacillus wulumuqiensis TaxID=1567107 RepID=UPI000619F775|nr:contractile injection system protein, VgrG/Pvc8 family [Paenibacillus wulumuqiensis]